MNRLTTAYEPALAILEILLGGIGTGVNRSSRDIEVPGFLFDMNRFFQMLLGRFLTQYLADYQIMEEASIYGLFEYSAKHNPKRDVLQLPDPTTVSALPTADYFCSTPSIETSGNKNSRERCCISSPCTP